MTTELTVGELTERLERATTLEEVRSLLSEVACFPRSHPDAAKLGALESRAIVYLRQATVADPVQAKSVIIATLLPRCLDLPDEYTGPWPQYTEVLGDWLSELPLAVRAGARDEVLRVATDQLDTGNLSVGLRLIARVGYARRDICEQLELLSSTFPGELGERALSVRVYLGIPDDGRTRLLTHIHHRLGQDAGYRMLDVARRIGNRETLDAVLIRFEKVQEVVAPGSIDDAISVQAIVSILGRLGDPILANEVWGRVRRVADTQPLRQLERILDGGIVSSFPAADVVSVLAARIAGLEANYRRIVYLRLKECVLPIHVLGWHTIQSEKLRVLREDASSEVGQVGLSMTMEIDTKEAAWEVLLCVGRSDELPSFNQAIRSVAGGYVKNTFFELAACLALPELLDDVWRVFAAKAPDLRWGVEEHLVAQVGAVHVAHSCQSADGFNALLAYQPAREGILLRVIEAVAELAHPNNCAGDRGRIVHLLVLAEGTSDSTARTIARAALAMLMGKRALNPAEAGRVIGLPAVEGADPHSLRALYLALYDATDVPLPPHLYAQVELLAMARRPVSDLEREADLPAAAELLHASRLTELDAIAFDQQFGLFERKGRVHLEGDSTPNTAFLLARRFAQNPARFMPAVVTLLLANNPFRAAPIIAVVRDVGYANPPEVLQAIVELVHRMDDGLFALPDLIDLLAEIAPHRLLADEWPLLNHWLPQARAALAMALGRLKHAFETDAARHQLLFRLAGDGVYSVRRAAYRAFAASDVDTFRSLILGWAIAQGEAGEELRRRAAEAVAWVAAPQEFAFLEWDLVAEVRNAYHQALQQRRERELAEYHCERVLAVTAPGDVIPNWRHGVGLVKVGDDQTVLALKERARTDVPPNVSYWLGRIRKAVQRRWDEVVRKWPQPVFTRHGRYEVVKGTIEREQVGTFPAKVHLWLDVGEGPASLYSWGGWAEARGSQVELSKLAWSAFSREPELDTLKIPGRANARILITALTSQIVFRGSDAYPEASTPD